MSPDQYTINCAIRCATAAWNAGRRDEWLQSDDYRDLEDELETQPDEGDRRVFGAAWHGYMYGALHSAEETLRHCKEDATEITTKLRR